MSNWQGMESLREALSRLERDGFGRAFRATLDGDLESPGLAPLAPESLVIVETVRFEGESDPADESVLFALRSRDGRVRGTFLATYGSRTEAECAAVMHRLPPASGRGGD